MSRKHVVLSVLFSLVLAACGGLDETPATGNVVNVADAGETADAGASCPSCPACQCDAGVCPTCPSCPVLDAGPCPSCPAPPAPAMEIVVTGSRATPADQRGFIQGRVNNFHGDVNVAWKMHDYSMMNTLVDGGPAQPATEDGRWTWTFTFPFPHGTDVYITATATDSDGCTAELVPPFYMFLPNPPVTVVNRGTLHASLGPNTPAGVTTITPDNDRHLMEIVLCAEDEAVQASETRFFLSGFHGSIGNWQLSDKTTLLASGQVPEGAGHLVIGFANTVVQPGVNSCQTLRLRLDTAGFHGGETLNITMEQTSGLGMSSNEVIATSVILTTSWSFVAPPPPANPRLFVHFAANTPQGASAPAFEETMVKAILTASVDEDIRVDTITYRVTATHPGLGNWKQKWDNGPPPPGNTLDSGTIPDYSGGWTTITARVDLTLFAGRNLAVSLYMDTQVMRAGDAVSLQIIGATGVGTSSGAAATVTVPATTVTHTY